MTNAFADASERIADRYVRRFGIGLDGQNVRDHAYKKVNRCITIRKIAGIRGLSEPTTMKDVMTYWNN